MLAERDLEYCRYALDADAAEDPTVHRIPDAADNDSFECAPENMFDGDIDGHVTLKAGEAPEKFIIF